MQVDDCVFAGVVVFYTCPEDRKEVKNMKVEFTENGVTVWEPNGTPHYFATESDVWEWIGSQTEGEDE